MSNAFIPQESTYFLIARYYSNYSESIYIFLSLFFNISQLRSLAPDQNPMWSFNLAVGNSRALLGRSCGGQPSSPPHTQCSVRALPSRTAAGCSQGLGLRHLHSEASLLEVSAEAPPRSFCQHLLIGGISLSTFPHSDSVFLHSWLFPPSDPRAHKKAGTSSAELLSSKMTPSSVLHVIWPKPGPVLWGEWNPVELVPFTFASYPYCLRREERLDCWFPIWLTVSSPGSSTPV